MRVTHEHGRGYAMWNFEGTFGIIRHRRARARIEQRSGYAVDADLLDLMLTSRVT